MILTAQQVDARVIAARESARALTRSVFAVRPVGTDFTTGPAVTPVRRGVDALKPAGLRAFGANARPVDAFLVGRTDVVARATVEHIAVESHTTVTAKLTTQSTDAIPAVAGRVVGAFSGSAGLACSARVVAGTTVGFGRVQDDAVAATGGFPRPARLDTGPSPAHSGTTPVAALTAVRWVFLQADTHGATRSICAQRVVAALGVVSPTTGQRKANQNQEKSNPQHLKIETPVGRKR